MSIIDIAQLNDHKELEIAGKSLSLQQALHLLAQFGKFPESEQWKLSPILLGMSEPIFLEMLMNASSQHLSALKQEAMAEPLQHHLTLLLNKWTAKVADLDKAIDTFERSVKKMNPQVISKEDVKQMTQQIEQIAYDFTFLTNQMERAQVLAWNSNREDLVDKLSALKEYCQRAVIKTCGHPGNAEKSPTGLHASLQDKLFSLLGNNEDPAIESLANLGIAQPEDYLNVGLIDTIEHADIKKYHELYQLAKRNLEKHGLFTVSDLKKNGIFSRQTLMDFMD